MFHTTTSSQIGIAITPRYGTMPAYRTLDIDGLMVTDATSLVGLSPGDVGMQAGPYFDTSRTRLQSLPVCEDTDGTAFRRDSFHYGCARVCPDGYDGSCPDEAARRRCYYEVVVSHHLEDLPAQVVGTPAGFVAGNYNYRIESLAVNFVGVGLRDCTGLTGSTASTCYAAGNISYSLEHHAPFIVWNARGQQYSAPLFAGRIEGARGLAAERYITNPISSSDQALLADYVRPDWQGRPLGGALTLRIWDDGGIRFDRLEDVQLVVNYRYWQRQQ
jgi:hypothetical protein